MVVVLDSDPLGVMTNPKLSPTTIAILTWAQSMRAAGHRFVIPAIADPKELDGDVLIASQAIDMGYPTAGFIIATTNPAHIAQFAPCDLWTNIKS